MAEGDATRPRKCRHGERIGCRSRPDEEDRHVALENLAKDALYLAIGRAAAVGGGKTRGMGGERFRNLRMGTGPVVGSEVHCIILA
jgi:hypothetical protein